MKYRTRWIALTLVLSIAWLSACGALDATPTPTLIMPDLTYPAPETPGAAIPSATLEASPTLPSLTDTPQIVTETPQTTQTEDAAGASALLDASPALTLSAEDWPLAHHDYQNTRASLNLHLDGGSAAQLEEVWRFSIPVSAGQSSDLNQAGLSGLGLESPLIANDIVYLQDSSSNLYALDLQTGQLRWEYRPAQPSAAGSGPGLGYGKVFLPVGKNALHALNQDTGEVVWMAEIDNAQGLHQPTIFGGLVLTGTSRMPQAESDSSSAASSNAAIIYALDQESGAIVWQYQGAGSLWQEGGKLREGGVLRPPAVDTERGLAYWGTGSPPQLQEDVRAQDALGDPDLRGSAILALDLATGRQVWFGDQIEGDLFGQDARISPLLIEVDIDEQPRRLVIGAGLFGSVAALDAQTGEPVWRVTLGESARAGQQGTAGDTQTSGYLSGVQGPMAYAEGVLFVPVTSMAAPLISGTGQAGGYDLSQAAGELAAVDARTAEVRWTRLFNSALTGGVLVAGGLVIAMTYDGAIFAMNRENGLVVWQAISAPDASFLPAVAGDLLLVPASGQGDDYLSLVALRAGPASRPTATGSPTATATIPAVSQPATATPGLPGTTPTRQLSPTPGNAASATPTPPASPSTTLTPTP